MRATADTVAGGETGGECSGASSDIAKGAAVKIDVRVTNVAEECVLACKTKEETLLPGYYGAQLRLDTESITRWLSEPLQTAHYIPKG